MSSPEQIVVESLAIARSVAKRYCRTMPVAITREDLVQEAAIEMLHVARTHPGESAEDLGALLYLAATRRMWTILKWKNRECRAAEFNHHVDDLDTLMAPVGDLELQLIVRERLRRLPAVDQVLLYRHYWLDQEGGEIARPGQSAQAALDQISRVLHRCRYRD